MKVFCRRKHTFEEMFTMQHTPSASMLPIETSSSTTRRVSSLRQNISFCVVILLAWCIMASSASGQNIKHTQNNLDSAKRSDFTVDPTTLGLGFQLTITNYPGRAGMSLPVTLSYSSKLWRMNARDTYNSFPYSSIPKTRTEAKYAEYSASGWTTNFDLPRLEGLEWMPYDYTGAGICSLPSCMQENSESATFYVYRMMVHMPDGSAIELRRDDTPFTTHTAGGVYYAVDGSRMRYDAGADVLYLADGSYYRNLSNANGVQYIDRNGNTLSYNLSTKQWTDTLGRIINRPPLDSSLTGPVEYKVKGVGGVELPYNLYWSYLADVRTDATQPLRYTGDRTLDMPPQPISPALFTSTVGEVACSTLSQVFNPIVLHKIELPNGRAYTFTYNVWGEIDKVVYPTGAYERYRYDMIQGISASLYENDVYRHANRGVVERWVSETGDGTDEAQHHWQYSAGKNNETDPYTVVITAPDGSRTERLLKGPQGESRFGFEHVLSGKAYDERAYSAPSQQNSNGQMLRRTLTEWTNTGPLSGGEWSATRDARVTKQVEVVLDTTGPALSATTTFDYDADMNVIATKRYGYVPVAQSSAQTEAVGFFSLGTLLRTEETTFLVNDPNIGAATRDAYRARNLLSLPTSTRVKDGAGNIIAQRAIRYDEATYPLLTYSSVASWTDPQTSVRGLATTASSWLNTTNTWLSSHAQYDQCGNPRKTWDARGNQSQVDYVDSFSDGINRNTFAYPTHTSSADPDGTGPLTALTSDTVYDLTSGVVTSQTDANNQTTTMEYAAKDALDNDNLLLRLTKVNLPGGGWTAYAYGDQPGNLFVMARTALDATRSTEARQYTDRMGREIRSEMSEGSTSILTDKQYDQMGRLWRTSNPYRTGEAVPWTTTACDGLGRVLTATTPDGAQVNTVYNGDQATVTDPAGKQRSSTTDALGRLTQVVEVLGEGGLEYVTTYTYDVLDNLRTVTQGEQTRTFVYDSLSHLTATVNPESGTSSYQYDNNGNLSQKVDARSVTTTYAYDALNRATTRSYSDATPAVTYTYDAADISNSKGRLTSSSNSVSTTSYTGYDAMGRITGSSQVTDGQTYSMSYAYDLAGNLTQQTYPSGRVVTTSYDNLGRLSQVSGQKSGEANKTYVTSFSYTSHGAVKDMKLGNNLWEHTSYNSRLQPIEIGLGTTQAGVDRLKLNYFYGTINNNGNLQSQTVTVPNGPTLSQNYAYDALNRLKSVEEINGATQCWKQTFIYDRYGNRTFDAAHTTYPSPLINPAINSANNRTAANQGYDYDLAGNLTTMPGLAISYDAENHQVSANDGQSFGVSTYTYDAGGRRIKKVTETGNSTIIFVYDAMGQMVAEYSSSSQSSSGGTSYLTSDSLGTPRVITDASGNVKARHDYSPFGEEIGLVGGRAESQKYVVDNVRQKFTQYERDKETGLDYAQARYYASAQGRFTSADPLMASGITGNPQSWNRYTYAFNNPLRFTDPSGMVTGDYYNDQGDWIGTDGLNDGQAYFVTNQTEVRQIRQATNSGTPAATHETYTSALTLPSQPMRQAIGADAVARSNAPAGRDTRGGFHEEGGIIIATANGQLDVPAQPGGLGDPTRIGVAADINVTNPANPNLLTQATDPSQFETEYHVHPAGQVRNRDGSVSFFTQPPSNGDITRAGSPNAAPVRLGYRIVVGACNNRDEGGQRAYFYNGTGTLGSMPLNRFVNLPRGQLPRRP
jgi:RHS repeat-associated protein